MPLRAVALVAVAATAAFVAGCARATEPPQSTTAAPPVADAASTAVPDAALDPPSPFVIVARGPTAQAMPYETPLDSVGVPMALVRRLAGGGLVVASQFARAHADGPGPLSVELLGRGLENEVLYSAAIVQGGEGLRWVWTDASLSVVVAESDGNSGPGLASYQLGATGFKQTRPSSGLSSAVLRDGSVLALERRAFEIPDSSIYPKGSEYAQNQWSLTPARIVVLSGKAIAPAIPAGACAKQMSAATDGTLVVLVDDCAVTAARNGVLRFAPSVAQAKVEWFAGRDADGSVPDDVSASVATANEIYVSERDHLHTWNGKEWSDDAPFPRQSLVSLSRAPDGALWAVRRGAGGKGSQLVKRSAGGSTWSTFALPAAPADKLDEQAYAVPTFDHPDFFMVSALPEDQEIRAATPGELIAYSVDATADEVLVLATVEHEAFVLSTAPRAPVARLPSIPVQRARLAQSLPRELASAKACKKSFLSFPEATTAEALRAAVGDAATIGEATVEGEKRLVVYGERKTIDRAATRAAALAPRRLCGPAVVERSL